MQTLLGVTGTCLALGLFLALAVPSLWQDERLSVIACYLMISAVGVAGIVYVLRTGCQWKALPKESFGSASAIHTYFLKWARAGLFSKLWEAGITEYDELKGIAWDWQSIDGAMTKAPLAQESVGRNPTDRGKNGDQTTPPGRRPRYPARHRGDRGQSA